MKILMSVFIFVVCISCAAVEYSKADIEKIETDMGLVNQRIRGYLYRKVLIKDLTNLTKEIYTNTVLEKQQTSDKEYVDLLKKSNVEILIKAKKTNFVVCVKDKDALLIMCDLANTTKVEQKWIGKDLKLEDIIQKIKI